MPVSSAVTGDTAASSVTAAVRKGQVLVAAAPDDRYPALMGWPVVAVTEAVVLRAASCRDPRSVAAVFGSGRVVCCYLDRILLIAGTAAGSRALIPHLYDVLGEAYELLADTGRNIAAAEWAFNALTEVTGTAAQAVLDVGCGSGLSLRARNRPSRLVGWDPSSVMRSVAATAGMPVLGDLSVAGVWDAAVACYVLHLPGVADTLPRVARVLRPGGVLVGNLHRTADPDALSSVCAGHGITCQVMDRHPLHGDLVALFLSRPCDIGAA